MLARHEFLYKYPFGCYEGYKAGVLIKQRFDDALCRARLRAIMASHTPAEINAGYASAAAENKALGFSND